MSNETAAPKTPAKYVNAYGCVICQIYHYEGEKIYTEHILSQSKHGISKRELPEKYAGGFDLPPTVFNATTPARCLVRIKYIGEAAEAVSMVRSFASEAEFLFYWQKPANFGLSAEQMPEYEILSPAQIAEYLLPLQQRIIEAEKLKAEAKKVFEAAAFYTKELVDLVGFGYFFQDAAGIVYKTNLPEWKSQKIEHQEICRTRYEGEAKGSLSMPEARAAGFTVEGEGEKPKKEKKYAEQNLSGEF